MKPILQMRVEIEEKAKLLAEARSEGITISDLMRRRCLGEHAVTGATPRRPRGPIPPKSTDLISEIVKDVQQAGPDPLRIAQLKAQGYTTPVATRMAKAEMESD